MVSDFLCECHGRLCLTPDQQLLYPDVAKEARTIIHPGKNGDGYWLKSDLVKQTEEKAIPIFKILHPDCDALFAFDNSQNYHAMAPDALVASRLNLSNGGKSVQNTRSGWFSDESGQRIEQTMQTANGMQKGIKTILSERSLWTSDLSLKQARTLLANQPDFLEQKNGYQKP